MKTLSIKSTTQQVDRQPTKMLTDEKGNFVSVTDLCIELLHKVNELVKEVNELKLQLSN